MNNKEDNWDWDDKGQMSDTNPFKCIIEMILSPLLFIVWMIMCAIACFSKDGEEQLDRLCPFPDSKHFNNNNKDNNNEKVGDDLSYM